MNTEPTAESPEPRVRKIYASPSLVVYGAVSALTQGGSKGMNENTGQTGTDRKLGSERRVKENIVRIGDHPFGFGLYLFDYRPEHRAQWGHGRQCGVMIDEVEHVMPEAVSMHPDGYKRVDYGLLGISQRIN